MGNPADEFLDTTLDMHRKTEIDLTPPDVWATALATMSTTLPQEARCIRREPKFKNQKSLPEPESRDEIRSDSGGRESNGDE